MKDWLLQILPSVTQIAITAGGTIASFDPANTATSLKADNSPVTAADLAANAIIVNGLSELTPDIPILSEESPIPDALKSSNPDTFWCIDPLDGTKGFLKRLGEYSVNIALVHEHRVVLAVLFVPTPNDCYQAICLNDTPILANYIGANAIFHDLLAPAQRAIPWAIASSAAHWTSELQNFYDHLQTSSRHHAHSALKFGWLMRGTADIFVRISPTNSWDTAAGHCLLNAIGGEIVDFKGQPLRYEFIGPIWLNPSFIAVADKAMLELIPFSKLPSEHSETTAPLHSLPSK